MTNNEILRKLANFTLIYSPNQLQINLLIYSYLLLYVSKKDPIRIVSVDLTDSVNGD